MKITVALSFLAAIYVIEFVSADSTDLEILRIQVRNMKWNVETTIRRLELLRTQAEDDTLREISLKWNEEQDSHRTYKTLLLSGIRNEIDTAKAAGKSVDSCYEEAVVGIEKNEKVAYDDAANCEEIGRNSIHNNLGFIDNLISTAQTLSMELDNVFLNCHDSDIYRMQSCIIGELARIEASLRTLESDSTTAEITVMPVSKNVVMQAGNCIKQAYSITYSAGVTIRMRVTQCIETMTTTTQKSITTEETTTKESTTTKEPTTIKEKATTMKEPKTIHSQ